MSYVANGKEIAAVFKLSGPDRYSHFVRRVADWGEIWSLGDGDGWKLLADDAGRELVPVWPAAAFVQALCIGEWAGCRPRAIAMDDWLEKWTPGMVRDGRKVAVPPTPEGRAVTVEPERLAADIRDAQADFLDA
ncbi:MAG: hypothetical protein BGO49_16020 [Planctomycetales bacterium 71-10]|nr:MAG: hypothetical protein BGO49_16020 [Planctomycetales bacterium 71-10]